MMYKFFNISSTLFFKSRCSSICLFSTGFWWKYFLDDIRMRGVYKWRFHLSIIVLNKFCWGLVYFERVTPTVCATPIASEVCNRSINAPLQKMGLYITWGWNTTVMNTMIAVSQRRKGLNCLKTFSYCH